MATSTVNGRAAARKSSTQVVPIAITPSPEFAKGKPELTLSRPYAARAMETIGKPFEKAGRFDQQSMVCGQCHVEYYFDGKTKQLNSRGMTA